MAGEPKVSEPIIDSHHHLSMLTEALFPEYFNPPSNEYGEFLRALLQDIHNRHPRPWRPTSNAIAQLIAQPGRVNRLMRLSSSTLQRADILAPSLAVQCLRALWAQKLATVRHRITSNHIGFTPAAVSQTSRKPICDMLVYGSVPRRALGR